MTQYPKISIITPSFNQGQFIEQTIRSVIEQDYSNLEYIIIDGGSTDNTIEIIKKYEKYLTYWISEPDKGQTHAINKGLQKATGEIFNWINSDDFLEKNALKTVAQYFSKYKDLQIVCGYSNIFDADNPEKDYKFRTHLFNSVEKTIIEEKINQQGMFYKMSCVRDLGLFNSSLHYVMDLEFWFRFMAKYGLKNSLMIDTILGNFRIHDSSKTVEFEKKFREEANQIFYYLTDVFNLPQAIRNFYKPLENYTPQNWTFNYISAGKFLKAISKRYLFDFYKQNNIKAAQIAFINQVKNRQVLFNKAYLSLFFRLFISHKKYGE